MTQLVGWDGFVDTTAPSEHDRLRLLEEVFDPITERGLDRLAVAPGWRCLEVGAGAGSVARRMAELAGPDTVVATDVSTDLLRPLADAGVTVLRHDVTTDPAPGEFDLIHCRFVLEHLPAREQVLDRLVSWLAPGGWLLIEAGCTAPQLSSDPVVGRAMQAMNTVLSGTVGTAPAWARRLPLPLERAGLVDVTADGVLLPARGGSPLARWLTATHRLIAPAAVAAGLLTEEEFAAAYRSYADPSFVDYTWLTVTAGGRRG